MKICSNCFNDEEIKNFIISSSSEIAHCDCCENDDCVIDLSELYDFFIEFTGLYCKDEGSSTDLIEALNSQWNIFSSEKLLIVKFVYKYMLISCFIKSLLFLNFPFPWCRISTFFKR